MKEEIQLLCSYEEYKQGLLNNVGMSEEATAAMMLALKFQRTEDEEKQYQELSFKLEKNCLLKDFTRKTHEITDKYILLKDIHDLEMRKEEYEEIGRMQCEIEVLKEKWNKLWD